MQSLRPFTLLAAIGTIALGTALAGSAQAKTPVHHRHHPVAHTLRAKAHHSGHRTRVALHHASAKLHHTGHSIKKAVLHHK